MLSLDLISTVSTGDACLHQAEGFQLPEPNAFLLRCGPSGVAAWSAGTDVTTDLTPYK